MALSLEPRDDLRAMVALDLDHPMLCRAARAAKALEVARDCGQVAGGDPRTTVSVLLGDRSSHRETRTIPSFGVDGAVRARSSEARALRRSPSAVE